MDMDRLLDHSDWVRKLASNLVNDPNEAEDLVQDTWTAALESPPREEANSRSWLARVLRNFAYSSFRRRSRRSARERAAASTEVIPSPEASLEKLETTRLLIDLVFDLEEPGRTAVVLRYFEGLTSREIARRLDTSPGAVRMRLKRALGSLRTRLEERSGESGDGWKSLLLPLVGGVGVAADSSGALAASAGRAQAAGSGSALSGLTHAVVMAALAVSCFAGGWSLAGAGGEGVAVVLEADADAPSEAAPSAAACGESARIRSLEDCIEELEARLETSRQRLAEKADEIFELKTRLAAHVTATGNVFDPA